MEANRDLMQVRQQGNELLQALQLEGNEESIRRYKAFFHLYSAGLKRMRSNLEILEEEFRAAYDYNPIHHIEYRLKKPKSILEKLQRRNLPMDMDSIRQNITDIAGLRVVCNYIDDIYRIEALLLRERDVHLVSRKDYIETPKENGYRSLHLIVELPVYMAGGRDTAMVELQLRTIAMDFWASLEHHIRYKSAEAASPELQEELRACAEDAAKLDNRMLSIFNRCNTKLN